MQHAQIEFKAYLSLENAWPRHQDTVIDKLDTPMSMYERVTAKHKAYQTPKFKARYKQMKRQVSTYNELRKKVSNVIILNDWGLTLSRL